MNRPESETGPSSVRVCSLDESDVERWNSFVRSRPESTFFHLAEWKTVLERAFGHPTFYLFAEREGQVCGVLPLGQIRSRLFGNSLISLPFCVYGGILAADERAHQGLERAACELADRLRVDHLELRNRQRRHPDWPCKDLYVHFRKPLAENPEENLKAIPRKQRAMVRKGIKAGLTSEVDEGVERLFDIYSESVHNLGTPVFPRRYFRVLKEVFGDACEVLTILSKDRPVASVLSFLYRDEVLPYYGGGTAAARGVAANDFMYWEVMRRACERGVGIFDYGRSKQGVGSYRFKKHWGFEPEPLYYEYYLVRATEMPDVNPLNPRYQLMIKIWRRLPLGLTRLIGPLLARNLG